MNGSHTALHVNDELCGMESEEILYAVHHLLWYMYVPRPQAIYLIVLLQSLHYSGLQDECH